RVIPSGSNIIFVSYGPLVSAQFCYFMYGVFLVSNSTTFYTTIASFLARWYILRSGGAFSSVRVWLLVAAVILPPGATIAIIFAFAKLPEEQAKAIYQRSAPPEDISVLVITGNVDFINPAMILACFVIFILVTPLYMII
ncbi:hypothetical protein PENTCL1PPCAC_14685, partial [Pristionchus entomophagus]